MIRKKFQFLIRISVIVVLCFVVALGFMLVANFFSFKENVQKHELTFKKPDSTVQNKIKTVRNPGELNSIVHSTSNLSRVPTYSLEKLKPYYTPKDQGYYKDIDDLYGLVENWESVVGVDISEQKFSSPENISLSRDGKYQIYFGLLHAHTEESDGVGPSEYALQTAKDVAGLDFFALTDHSEALALNNAFDHQKDLCRKFSTTQFIALCGFEYSPTALGHYVVLNTPNIRSSIPDFLISTFYHWLSLPQQSQGLMIFAHPGFHPYRRKWDHLQFKYDENLKGQVVGIETIHKNIFEPSLRGFTGKQSYLDDAWQKGWRVGPIASQDNHRSNWGIQDGSRLALLLPKLSEENIYDALRHRRFYSTQNEQLRLSVSIEKLNDTWSEMGEEISRKELPKKNLRVYLKMLDSKNTDPLSFVELIWNGEVIHTFSTEVAKYKSSIKDLWFEKYLPLNVISKGSAPWRTIGKPYAEQLEFEIPQALWDQEGAQDYFYFRLFHGIEKKLITITSPNLLF